MEIDEAEQSKPKEILSFHCFLKYLLFAINVLVWVVGVVFIGVGSWAHNEKTKYNSVKTLSADPTVLLILVGSLMFTIAFCGCVGFLRENKILLRIYMVSLTIIFVLEIVTGFIAFFFVEQTKSKVTDAVTHAIEHYIDDADLQNIIDSIQQSFQCCGGYSYHDWNNNEHYNCSALTVEACGVPFSCCRTDKMNTQCGFGIRRKKTRSCCPSPLPTVQECQVTEAAEIIYIQGCVISFTNWFNENLILIGGLAFGFAFIQLLGILGASHVIKNIDHVRESARATNLHPDF